MRKKENRKKGTTLVEMIVTLLLISIMMTMAAASLSSAAKIFVRVQKTQYAQSIADTVMTELRTITKDASGYVKIYPGESGFQPSAAGSTTGTCLEFLNPDGYVELVSTDGCEKTQIYIGDNNNGSADAVEKGQLLTRYYTRNSTTGRYFCRKNGTPVARAVATAFGKGFYMGNYLEIEYSVPSGTTDGTKVSSIVAKVTLYSDKDRKHVVASDTELLEFRNPLIYTTAVTAS
ncbi:PulJ/GspJ family protein [Dorea sp.]